MRRAILGSLAIVLISAWTECAQAHPGVHLEIDRLSEALAQHPDDVTLRIERAFYLRLHEEYDRALADLDHARRLAPDHREIHRARGLVLAALQQDEEADRELTHVLECGEACAEAHGARAEIRLRGERFTEALADYDAALALEGNVEVYLRRGALQERLGLLDQAAAGYREGITRQGGAMPIRQALIRVEIARKDFAAALAAVDDALGQAPVKTHWHLRRAEVFDAAQQTDHAREERERALREADRALKQRATAPNLYARAQVLIAQGRLDAARKELSRALDKSPRFAPARELLNTLKSDGAPGTTTSVDPEDNAAHSRSAVGRPGMDSRSD